MGNLFRKAHTAYHSLEQTERLHNKTITKGEQTMPTKFPIDYEPGTRHFYLIDKETGEKMSEIFQMKELIHKPWPIDDIEIETEPEPPKSLTLSGAFTLKTKMKANQRRKLIRALSGKQKLPRKLKKACRHIHHVNNQKFIEPKDKNDPLSFEIIGYQGFVKNKGYPHTKWVTKAIRYGNRIVAEAAAKVLRELDMKEKGNQL